MGMKFYATLPDTEGRYFQPSGPLMQLPQKMENGIVIEPAKTVEFVTDDIGLIRLPDDEYQERSVKAMAMLIKRFYSTGSKRILGPFDTDTEALVKQNEARPKSDAEKVVLAGIRASRLETENSELKAKLAALTGGKGKEKE